MRARFKEDNEFSHDPEHKRLWKAAYKSFFPGLVSIEYKENDRALQRRGIDVRLELLGDGINNIILIDEKKRRKYYHDILIEFEDQGSPGWVNKKLDIDCLAYLKAPAEAIWIFDWRALVCAWRENEAGWRGTYPSKTSYDGTLNTPVPPEVLCKAVAEAGRIDGTRSKLSNGEYWNLWLSHDDSGRVAQVVTDW